MPTDTVDSDPPRGEPRTTFGSFHTTVLYVPRDPGSVLGGFWTVRHNCTLCGREIPRAARTLTTDSDLTGHLQTCPGVRS